jgi:hypothetical protein
VDRELVTYDGSCHCGSLLFSFRAEAITRGVRCNCSICGRRGAVMSAEYIPRSVFSRLEGLENLAIYNFGDDMMNHYFCRRCGIFPFGEVKATPGIYRLNLGCIEGLDPLALEIGLIDGKAF